MTAVPPSPEPRKYSMTLYQYGDAIRAAYEEGYIQGAAHPKFTRIIPKAKELAGLFWRTVEFRLQERAASVPLERREER